MMHKPMHQHLRERERERERERGVFNGIAQGQWTKYDPYDNSQWSGWDSNTGSLDSKLDAQTNREKERE